MTTRPLTRTLAQVLDTLTETERRQLVRISIAYGEDTVLGRVLSGVRAECLQIDVTEAATLAALEADHQAETDRLVAEHFPPLEPHC